MYSLNYLIDRLLVCYIEELDNIPGRKIEFPRIIGVQRSSPKTFAAPVSFVMDGNIRSKHRPCLIGIRNVAEIYERVQPWEVTWRMCHCRCTQAPLTLAKHDEPTQSKTGEALYVEALPPALDQHACGAIILRFS